MDINNINKHVNEPYKKTKNNGNIQLLSFNDQVFTPTLRSISNINHLSKMALHITQCDTFGHFLDEEHYLQTYQLVTAASAELKHRTYFIIKYILPKILTHKYLLDIGPGNGKLTKKISRTFKHITAIDTNKKALNKLAKILEINQKKRNIQLDMINCSISHYTLPKNFFNLVILSQVIYYINEELWLTIIIKIYESLAAGGIMIVILSGAKYGKAKLIKYFNGKQINTGNLISKMTKYINKKIKIFECYELYQTPDILPMLHIAGFFLHDVNVTVTKENLKQYLKQFHTTRANGFILSSQQTFIAIQKNT